LKTGKAFAQFEVTPESFLPDFRAYSSFCRLKSLDLPKSFIAYSLFNINIPRDFAMPKKTQMSEIFITEGSLVSKNTSVYRALREVLACKMSYRSTFGGHFTIASVSIYEST